MKLLWFVVAVMGLLVHSDATAQRSDDALPADFRGEITYSGNFNGSVSTKPDRMRNFSLGEALRSATSGQTLPLGGEYTVTVRFDGNTITGSYTPRNASGRNGVTLDPGRFTGTRNGTRCVTYDASGGDPVEVYCTRGRWEFAVSDQTIAQGHKLSLNVATVQTRFVDYVERDRERAAAEAQRGRERANRERQAAAEQARIAALPRASTPQVSLLADAIGQDSQSWAFNRYDLGSLSNVRIDRINGETRLRGDYTYNGGRRGWVSGRVINGRVECVQYHDTGGCAPVRRQGFARRGRVTETVRISAYTWYELARVEREGERYFRAVADVRRQGNTVSFLEIFNSNTLDPLGDGSLDRREFDCAQFTTKTLAGDLISSSTSVELRAWDEGARFLDPGSNGRSMLDKLCSGSQLPVIRDPVGTANRYIRGS